jgi:putative transposase
MRDIYRAAKPSIHRKVPLRLGSWHTKQQNLRSLNLNQSCILPVHKRNSFTSLNKIYFLTATIHNWLPLLDEGNNKQLIVDYLKKQSDEQLITVYGFVLMPNHFHLIWSQNKMNGKETPQGSLLKYTSHMFLKVLKEQSRSAAYEVTAANKKHEIWQRDSLSVEIYSREVAKQKLDYIHVNPVKGKWYLAKDDLGYYFSSARFYEKRH